MPLDLPPTLPEELAPIAFVVGSWTSPAAWAEHWSAVGDVLYGVALDGAGFEVLKIDRVQGVVRYVAQPDGRPPTIFPLVSHDDERAVFSNPEHDHPNTITYKRSGARGLVVTVEGSMHKLSSKWTSPAPVAPGIVDADRHRDPSRRQARSGMAPSGDLGFTIGTWGTESTVVGAYATVWRKEVDGTWTVVFDAKDAVEG